METEEGEMNYMRIDCDHITEQVEPVQPLEVVIQASESVETSIIDADNHEPVPSHHSYSKLPHPVNSCSQTKTQITFQKKQKLHYGRKSYVCPECKFSTVSSGNLKRHMSTHSNERPHMCQICQQTFRQKVHLNRHMQYKHMEKKVKCTLCDYTCASEVYDLARHMQRKHNNGNSTEPLTEIPCPKMNCHFKASTKKDLKQHMKFHAKGPELKLFCEKCSFVTDCPSRMRRHVVVHTKERPFECNFCSYKASQKPHLIRHVKTQHQNGASVKNITDLSICNPKNIPTVNQPINDLPATSRDQDLNVRTNITVIEEPVDSETHTKSSLEIEPNNKKKTYSMSDYTNKVKCFHCHLCTMQFHRLINLYKHLEGQHDYCSPESSDHQCIICDFTTKNIQSLYRHMRSHKSIPSSSKNCSEMRIYKAKAASKSQSGGEGEGTSEIVDDTAAAVKGLELIADEQLNFDSISLADIEGISTGDLVKINGQIYKVEISQNMTLSS